MFSHAFVLAGDRSYVEPLAYITSARIDLGKLAVIIFFIISGFLISGSWDRAKNFRNFIISRILRIFPGLAVSLIICIFIGAVISTNLFNYKASALSFFLRNITLYKGQADLAGVFLNNSYGTVVNGSLWTLRHEFTCYLFILAIGYVGFLNRISALLFWVFGCFCAKFISIDLNFFREFFPLFSWFMAGAVVYFYRDLEFSKWGIFLALLFCTAYVILGMDVLYIAPIISWVIIRFAYIEWFGNRFGKFGDFSYGMYIYAFPVQQFLSSILPKQNAYWNFLGAFFVTLFLACVSWYFVEKPWMNMKKRLVNFN